jgi:hypothetical protein
MELGAFVAVSVLTCCKLTKVASRLWDDIVVEFEDDPSGWCTVDGDVKLDTSGTDN